MPSCSFMSIDVNIHLRHFRVFMFYEYKSYFYKSSVTEQWLLQQHTSYHIFRDIMFYIPFKEGSSVWCPDLC